MRNVWRLKTHHEYPEAALEWTRLNNRIALGWGDVGDIGVQGYSSAQHISDAIRVAYNSPTNAAHGGLNLWSFYNEMKPHDLIILSSTTPRSLVVEVMGDYVWEPEKPHFIYDEPTEYQHQRRVRLSAWGPEDLWRTAGKKHAPGQSPAWPLFRCALPVK